MGLAADHGCPRVLACAPSDAGAVMTTLLTNTNTLFICFVLPMSTTAADVLCKRLAEFFGPDDLFRLNWWQRSLASVPLQLLSYCHLNDDSRFDLPLDKMSTFKVIVCTSVAAGVFDRSTVSPLSLQFDLVVLDEVSQATEGESLVPVSLVKNSGVVVLSGDPEQLGPAPRSSMYRAAGMNISLQERLLRHRIYDNIRPYFGDGLEERSKVENDTFCKFGVYLRHNYRSQVRTFTASVILVPHPRMFIDIIENDIPNIVRIIL